jgi:hypothetical protein
MRGRILVAHAVARDARRLRRSGAPRARAKKKRGGQVFIATYILNIHGAVNVLTAIYTKYARCSRGNVSVLTLASKEWGFGAAIRSTKFIDKE